MAFVNFSGWNFVSKAEGSGIHKEFENHLVSPVGILLYYTQAQMHYRDAQDNCRLIMGPTGHLAEPQTTEEHDQITKNAKTVLGYRWLNLKSYFQ
jgi:hypothetical protein